MSNLETNGFMVSVRAYRSTELSEIHKIELFSESLRPQCKASDHQDDWVYYLGKPAKALTRTSLRAMGAVKLDKLYESIWPDDPLKPVSRWSLIKKLADMDLIAHTEAILSQHGAKGLKKHAIAEWIVVSDTKERGGGRTYFVDVTGKAGKKGRSAPRLKLIENKENYRAIVYEIPVIFTITIGIGGTKDNPNHSINYYPDEHLPDLYNWSKAAAIEACKKAKVPAEAMSQVEAKLPDELACF